MEFSSYNNLTCYEAQRKMSLYIENDPYLTNEEHEAFETHLECCAECAREYEESRFVISLIKRYWTVNKDTLALIEKANQYNKPRMTVEEGWKDLCRRCPDLIKSAEKSKSLQFLPRISTIAACLAIGILTWIIFSNYSRPHASSQSSSYSKQVASTPKPSVKTELISGNGKVLIPPGCQIASAKEVRSLIINDKHQIVLNAGTALSIEPLSYNEHIGCIVKLTSGEILANIEHDGNPFVVSTAHGKAVITGTIFDVKVANTTTKLVVYEGTVRFESEKGFVEVTAGQLSEIVNHLAPTKPISCDSTKLTAWATGHEFAYSFTEVRPTTETYDITNLPLFISPEITDLENINYEQWIGQKREWFKQQFPWIFQFKDALAKEGIEVDYPELLIETGDVRQFLCFDTAPARFSAVEPNSLLETASDYGFDKQWLLENVPAAKSALEKPALSENSFTGLKAFERWLEYLDETKDSEPPIPIYSYHASKYLAETRSLIWFAVRDGKCNLTDKESAIVLALLQEEVTTACKCQNEVLYFWKEEKSFCDYIYEKTVDRVVGYIETMKAVEKTVGEYEID